MVIKQAFKHVNILRALKYKLKITTLEKNIFCICQTNL